MSKKMYVVNTWEESNSYDSSNKYYKAELKIILPEEDYYLRDTNIYFTWQADQKSIELYNSEWYAMRLHTEAQRIEGTQVISKFITLLNKLDAMGCSPTGLIDLLESKGYEQADYNSLSSKYETEKEWQTGNSYGITFPGKKYGYTSVIAEDEKEAIKKARKFAASEIAQGVNIENWANWLKECKVEFRDRGKDFRNCKDNLNLLKKKEEVA